MAEGSTNVDVEISIVDIDVVGSLAEVDVGDTVGTGVALDQAKLRSWNSLLNHLGGDVLGAGALGERGDFRVLNDSLGVDIVGGDLESEGVEIDGTLSDAPLWTRSWVSGGLGSGQCRDRCKEIGRAHV